MKLIGLCIMGCACLCAFTTVAKAETEQMKANGYRGIWYMVGKTEDEYHNKYGGGMGSYTANHIPLVIYSAKADKTFFVFGAAPESGENQHLTMISYYDHKTGMVPKPTVIHVRQKTNDAHCNPSLVIDDKGYLWVFAASHGGPDAFIYKSHEPYSIDKFDLVVKKEFSYPQPVYLPETGFSMLFTKYTGVRELYSSTSRDGVNWTEDRKYAGIGGHYQVSAAKGNKRATAFMYHIDGKCDFRTNLYYMETDDCGSTWKTADGKAVQTPLNNPKNEALVHDYLAEGNYVYINDLVFDREGRPIIFYVVTRGYESGPKNDPRSWVTARWTGSEWDIRTICKVDHNYDLGSLYVEDDGTWRVIGPSAPGPQKYATGGDIELWTSSDQGKSWKKERSLTSNSVYNHTYIRRSINAHPDFYAFWADGNAYEPSESRFYFTNKACDKVWMLPYNMTADFAKPTLVK